MAYCGCGRVESCGDVKAPIVWKEIEVETADRWNRNRMWTPNTERRIEKKTFFLGPCVRTVKRMMATFQLYMLEWIYCSKKQSCMDIYNLFAALFCWPILYFCCLAMRKYSRNVSAIECVYSLLRTTDVRLTHLKLYADDRWWVLDGIKDKCATTYIILKHEAHVLHPHPHRTT